MPKRSLYACHRPIVTALAASLSVVCVPAHVRAQPAPPPCAACIVFVLPPADAILGGAPLNGIELLIRPAEGPAPREALAGDATPAATGMRRALEAVRAAGGRAGLLLRDATILEAERDLLMHASRLVVDLAGTDEGGDALAFRVKTLLAEARGVAPDVPLGVAAAGALLDELFERDIGPYLDFTVRLGGEVPPPVVPGTAGAGVVGQIHPVEAGAELAGAGPGRWLMRLPEDPAEARRVLEDVGRAAPVLGEGLVTGGTADVRCGDVRQQTYLDAATLDTIAVVHDCTTERLAVEPASRGISIVALSRGTLLVRVPAGEGIFTEGLDVVGERALTVQEVVARHQAAAARQRREVRTLVSSGTLTLTFEAPGFPAPMTITSDSIIFAAPDGVEMEQRDIRVNGVAFRADGVPRLPLLEPERVASPPLTIALTDAYRYSLAGRAELRGISCYVVRFEPLDVKRTSFSGRAWIAADTFALLRVAAVQTNLRGPIVASEQIDEFRREGDAVWLLARSEVRQIYEGAGHRTPIHRLLAIERHEINPTGFEARRTGARESSSIMLRDTPEGFRYLERRRDEASGEVVREVTRPAVSVRTVVLGVVVDPNITKPLPFAGVNYVHFDLFGRGGQFNGFFGGTYAQLATSLPSIGGTRWQAGARGFAIASAYNDRAFAGGQEIYPANLAQRPARAAVWLLRPVGRQITVRTGYEFDYTHFAAAESTAPSFTVPAAQVAHGLRLAVEGQWAGLDASVWWTGARRAGWRRWGAAADHTGDATASPGFDGYDPRHRGFQRAGVTVGRSWIAAPRLVGRVEGAWMGGRDLDRFSRYSFGTFENRLRGYPAALIRYDRGAVLRAAAAFAAGRLVRIDGFADTAFVRDPGFGRRSRQYTGLGLASEMPAPFGILLGVEWGYGFQGVNADGTRGTHVVRVSGYKMF